jgi:hypothetical protein
VDGGVSILQYDDDTIIFMEHNLKKELNMNWSYYFWGIVWIKNKFL